MIQYTSAVKIVKKEFSKLKLKTEKVNILDSPGRILAEDIYADTPHPLFTNSAMDGYAVKYDRRISKWKVIGEISAGKFKNYKPASGEAVMIMTGSRIPDFTDTVIPFENVNILDDMISLEKGFSVKKLQNVRRAGEDINKGEKVLSKGTVIHSKHIQLAASCGKKNIKVYRKPKAAVLATGNELTDIDYKPKGDKIRASNLYSLLNLAMENGFQPLNLGILKDEKNKLEQIINNILSTDLDILISSGGVSEGKYDYLPDIFEELGVRVLFHKVSIKPGKPMLFGIFKNSGKKVLIFGLPGNPVSCYVNFILFIRNIYYSINPGTDYFHINAVLNDDLIKKDNKRHFVRGISKEKGGINYVSVSGNQSSANALGLSNANVLIEFPENVSELKTGSFVKCITI
jgi:molybdopterin molybdotransferase